MKLEDLDKHNIYSVPDKYFDELPMRIQKRVTTQRQGWHWIETSSPVWKYAVPALFALMVGIYFGTNRNTGISNDPLQIIAQVDIDDIVAYLENSDISTDEILEGYQPGTGVLDLPQDDVLPKQALPQDDADLKEILREYHLDIN